MPTILIVDDSATVRALVRSALEGDGHAIVEASSAAAALAALERDAADLVLTDVHMPEMDGLALTERLRADARFRALPILVLTTEASDALKARGRAAGATGWLVKPFRPDTLCSTVRRVLEPSG
jgi:two-component system chemotaxis response regulator CheY